MMFKKLRFNIAFMIMLCLPLFCAACASPSDPFIEIGGEEVESLYSVVGERKIESTSYTNEDGVETEKITYNKGAVSDEDIQKYIDALISDGFSQTMDIMRDETTRVVSLTNMSIGDSGFLVIVIESNPSGNTVLSYSIG